jgi:hypothetical protein
VHHKLPTPGVHRLAHLIILIIQRYFVNGILLPGPRDVAFAGRRYDLDMCMTGIWHHRFERRNWSEENHGELDCCLLAEHFPFVHRWRPKRGFVDVDTVTNSKDVMGETTNNTIPRRAANHINATYNINATHTENFEGNYNSADAVADTVNIINKPDSGNHNAESESAVHWELLMIGSRLVFLTEVSVTSGKILGMWNNYRGQELIERETPPWMISQKGSAAGSTDRHVDDTQYTKSNRQANTNSSSSNTNPVEVNQAIQLEKVQMHTDVSTKFEALLPSRGFAVRDTYNEESEYNRHSDDVVVDNTIAEASTQVGGLDLEVESSLEESSLEVESSGSGSKGRGVRTWTPPILQIVLPV